MNNYSIGHWDAYYGMQVTYTDFWRDGNMRNGHNPNNSFGAGAHHSFTDMMVKGGLTYKFNGRHLLTANITYGSQAPLPNDAYISPRVNDATPDGLKSGRIFSADLSYIFSTTRLQGRISLFQTNFFDQLVRNSYYYDGVTFVNHVMTGVNKVHHGVELGLSYKLDNHWTFDLAGTVSEYYFSNNPMGLYTSENGKDVGEYSLNPQERVYLNGVYVGGTPQVAGTFGVRYFINYWFLGANLNAFGRNFVEVAPSRRTASIYNGYTSAQPPLRQSTPQSRNSGTPTRNSRSRKKSTRHAPSTSQSARCSISDARTPSTSIFLSTTSSTRRTSARAVVNRDVCALTNLSSTRRSSITCRASTAS